MTIDKTDFPIEAYRLGIKEERERILKWIEENRTGIEFDDGWIMYRDRFCSEDLITFIKGEGNG
jgi:hypothetical protein